MALVVEDGSIVADANTYGTEEGLIAYATARGITITTDKEEEYLIRAMDVIEYLPLPGIKYTEDQALQFPRSYFYIDRFLIGTDEIPNLLIECQYEAAIAINEGYDPNAVVTRVKKRVTVGPITTEYEPSGPSKAIYQPLFNKLNKLLGNHPNNGFEFRVSPA